MERRRRDASLCWRGRATSSARRSLGRRPRCSSGLPPSTESHSQFSARCDITQRMGRRERMKSERRLCSVTRSKSTAPKQTQSGCGSRSRDRQRDWKGFSATISSGTLCALALFPLPLPQIARACLLEVIIGYRAQAKFLLVDGRPVERSAPTVQCWLSADASATAAPAFAVGMPELTAFRLLVSADMLRQQVRNQSRPTSSNIWSRLIKPAWRWRKGATIRDCRDR
jgi:hypothetical protein